MSGDQHDAAAATGGGTEDTGYAEGEGQRIRSLDDLFGRLDQQEGKLDRLAELMARVIPGSHADAQQRTETRLSRPTQAADTAADMGAQVRAELSRIEAERAEQADREAVKAAAAKLAEKAPRPPARRSTRLLGWGVPE